MRTRLNGRAGTLSLFILLFLALDIIDLSQYNDSIDHAIALINIYHHKADTSSHRSSPFKPNLAYYNYFFWLRNIIQKQVGRHHLLRGMNEYTCTVRMSLHMPYLFRQNSRESPGTHDCVLLAPVYTSIFFNCFCDRVYQG